MDLPRQIVGLAAASLTCISCVAFVRAILRGDNTTRWSSWLIWTVASAANLATYYGSGARASVWVPAAYVGVCAAILTAALWRRNPGGLTKMEVFCLAGAVSSLLVWWASGSAISGQIASVAVEVVAYIPIWLAAREENPLAWCLELAGSGLNMLAIAHLSFGLLLYPTAILVCNAVVVVLLSRGRAPKEPVPEAVPVV